VAESYYGYQLESEHTLTYIIELAELVKDNFPKLTYNKNSEGVTTIQTPNGPQQRPVYELGEVYSAFKLSGGGQLDFKYEKHANSRLNVPIVREVLESYMKYRDAARFAILEELEREKKAAEWEDGKEQREKEKYDSDVRWTTHWNELSKRCEWEHIDDVFAFFYEAWIDERKLHEFSRAEKDNAIEIAKTLRLRLAKLTASNPQAKPSEIGISQRIIQLMGELNQNDPSDKASLKALAQKVCLYIYFTGRNPLDEPLTKPKPKK
jgi:hypothetical protein